jgi:hypothetical protein
MCVDMKPDLTIAGLKLWIVGRQFEDNHDYWDGNWLRVEAVCASQVSRVSASGPILHLPEIARFRDACSRLNATLTGRAELECLEPNLAVRIAAIGPRGRISVTIDLTGDHHLETHQFRDEIDQSYLSDILLDLNSIMKTYPVRGEP